MPARKTKRGAQRTPITGNYDVIVCGASFAGLAAARELAGVRAAEGHPARVLMLDRYEIGERSTSACAAPTEWLEALGLERSIRQRFETLVVHIPHTTVPYRLPWSFATFDYPTLCSLLDLQNDAQFETATVTGRAVSAHASEEEGPVTIVTDRGEVSAPLVVDALGWRRVLSPAGYQPPEGPLSRAIEVHPSGSGRQLEIWIDRSLVPAGYGWSFPAADEVRVGVGSFDPRYHVREPTVRLAERLDRALDRYQGNWIPHRLRDATEHGVFFAGDSAGHCMPLTAEGIRTAFYFGIACGRELGDVLEGRKTRDDALRSYASFSARHARQFKWMLRMQRLVPRVPPRALSIAARAMGNRRFTHWAFNHYLNIAHPSFVSAASLPATGANDATPGELAA
ncbi:MAG: NAD(P)/FAD-dependent oxidoreductase [Solirubrobacterales bacterium]